MRSAPSYYVSLAGRRRPPLWLSAAPTLLAAAATVAVPAAHQRANLWEILLAVFPASAHSAFALSCAITAGAIAALTAEAVGRRAPVRPALAAVILTALLAPVGLAGPLWPALLAAAALTALPVPVRPKAANDNPAPADRAVNPFSLAA